MIYLDEQAIEEIAVGAAVLGTGGGGDPYIGKLMAQQAIKEFGPIPFISPEEVKDSDFCISSAAMGAPSVLVEAISAYDEFIYPLRVLEKQLGRQFNVIYPIECGGLNSMIPFIVAAQTQLPVADIDGMGRAFPELQMLTFHLFGCSVTPLVIGDCRKNVAYLDTISNFWAESFARAITVQVGGHATMAVCPLTGKQLKDFGIHNPVTLSRKIGQTILRASQNDILVVDAVLEASGGYPLFYGKVLDISRNTDGAFVRGKAILEGIDRDKGRTLELEFQNENIVAIADNKVIASVPDLICNLELNSGLPITTERIRFGQRILVLGLKCDSKWRSEKGLALVGPRVFRYDFDYEPIEEIWER